MTETYDGRQLVGLGLQRCCSMLVRMTTHGRRLETARNTNSAAQLRREIAKVHGGRTHKSSLGRTPGAHGFEVRSL
jgi:hypothetical protein